MAALFVVPNPIYIRLPARAGQRVALIFGLTFKPLTYSINTPLITIQQEFGALSQLVLSRDLTSADIGTGTWHIVATTADGQFNASIDITFTISAPVPAEGPPIFSGWPTAVQLTDNMKAGTVVASGTLTDSDMTPFNGTVNVGGAPLNFVA